MNPKDAHRPPQDRLAFWSRAVGIFGILLVAASIPLTASGSLGGLAPYVLMAPGFLLVFLSLVISK